MKRAAAGLLAIALFLSLSAGPAAAECVLTKHSKRVTKKVKRHGKLRREKRTKNFWTCDPVAPAPAAPTAPTTPPPATPTPPPAEEPEANALGVSARDKAGEPFGYRLSRENVKPGKVIVQLQNDGEDPHDLNIAPLGDESQPLQISVTPPGSQKTSTFELPEGTYRLWCDLEGHDAKGMHAELVVGGG